MTDTTSTARWKGWPDISDEAWTAVLPGTLDPHSREFVGRMYSGDPERYLRRLRAIGFDGLSDVLDAGCGFGQWSLALAGCNERVSAVDVSPDRVATIAAIADACGKQNIVTSEAATEELPFAAESFDAVFCYSVLYATDYHRSLSEFCRVLRPGGHLYLSTNGPGWTLFNLVRNHHPAANFNPRSYAWHLLKNTARSSFTGVHRPNSHRIMTPAGTRRILRSIGFGTIATAGDGCLRLPGREQGPSFYPGRYFGLANVFEMLATKPETGS